MIQLDPGERQLPIETSSQPPAKTVIPAKATPVTSRVNHWLAPIFYPLGRRIVMPFYFGRIEVTGLENIPTSGPVIFAPTHRSRWDGLVIPYAVGKPVTGRELRFMVSADECKGLQGWIVRQMGGFPVNTKQPSISSLRHGVELLRAGQTLVMFPEGDIFRDGLHPLKPGMARIALQVESGKSLVGLNIVPISIRYSDPFPQWGSDVKIAIGSPLKVADYTPQPTKKAAQRLTRDLEVRLKNLEEEKGIVETLRIAVS